MKRIQLPAGLTRLLAPINRNPLARSVIVGIALLAVCAASGVGYAYAISPAAVRQPAFEHLHFRMQLVVDGKEVNFADKKFQEGYSKDNCNVDLTVSPIHFHDKKNQFVHIHWKDLTGGMVLKYYGWNYIGGVDGLLGSRFDAFPNIVSVPTHGNELPKVPDGAKFYVYSGDEKAYKERRFDDFTNKELESFFGVQSSVQSEPVTLLDRLFPKASAHGGHEHVEGEAATTTSAGVKTEEDLKRINNLLGNVVIFVQKQAPSDEQIKARFNDLEPLSESTCGG